MKTPVLIATAAFLAGCAAVPLRVTRELYVARGCIASNSPMLVARRLPRFDGSLLSVTYSVIVENVGTEPYGIDLEHASVVVADARFPARCSVLGGAAAAFALEAHARWRIDCVIAFEPASVRLRERGDIEAELTIPVRLPDADELLAFTYLFRAEDAS